MQVGRCGISRGQEAGRGPAVGPSHVTIPDLSAGIAGAQGAVVLAEDTTAAHAKHKLHTHTTRQAKVISVQKSRFTIYCLRPGFVRVDK